MAKMIDVMNVIIRLVAWDELNAGMKTTANAKMFENIVQDAKIAIRESNLSNDIAKEYKYCSECNYMVPKRRINRMVIDQPCPNCHRVMISMFYGYGSKAHQLIHAGNMAQDTSADYYRDPPQLE